MTNYVFEFDSGFIKQYITANSYTNAIKKHKKQYKPTPIQNIRCLGKVI